MPATFGLRLQNGRGFIAGMARSYLIMVIRCAGTRRGNV